MGFIPISLDDLQVGLYIKLDYGWGTHPFLRNSFKLESHTDIGIIRKHQLTKITYDPTRSDPQALEKLAASAQSEKQGDPEEDVSVSRAEIEEAEQALQAEKEHLHEKLFSHQDTLKETEKAYKGALNQTRTVLKMISMGQAESLDLAKEVVGSMTDILQCPSPTLTLVNVPPPKDLTEKVFVHSMNVCSLSLLVGVTLELNQEDMQTLGQGAIMHNIGLHRVPSTVRTKKKDALSAKERQLFETYPHYGRQMVEGLPGVSSGCLDIISQHRENLDGSGYPQGLKGDQIAFLPRVVRVVTEYNSLLNNGHGGARLTPTQALTYLYTKLKEQCQPDLIETFIATVTIYPPGSFVRLTDDTVGLVVKTNKAERLRPLVVVYETIQDSGDLVIIDLTTERALAIKESLHPKDIDPKILAQLQQSLGGIKGYFVSA